MTTPFARLEQKVSAAVDRLHAERTRISPRAQGEFVRGGNDATRVARDVLGVIDFNPVMVRAREQGGYDGYEPQVDGEKVHVSYTLSRLGTPPEPPKAGDTIEALDRPGFPRFRIVTVEADGLGRVLCRCVPA